MRGGWEHLLSESNQSQVSWNPNSHWFLAATIASCLLFSHTRLPPCYSANTHSGKITSFFHLSKNTPPHCHNDPSWQGELCLCGLQIERGGGGGGGVVGIWSKSSWEAVEITGAGGSGSGAMWCCHWASLAVTQRQAGRQEGREEGRRRWLCLWEGECLHTGHSRGAHVLAQKCKLICQSHRRREKNGREEEEGRKKNTHWKVANYSHRNLTLTSWLQPRSRRFCTWNGARCYFWDMTWWRNPRGSDRRRTLIQNQPHPPPTPFPLPSLHLFLLPSLWETAQTWALWPIRLMWQLQNRATQPESLVKELHSEVFHWLIPKLFSEM